MVLNEEKGEVLIVQDRQLVCMFQYMYPLYLLDIVFMQKSSILIKSTGPKE